MMDDIPINISTFEFPYEGDPAATCRGVSHDTKDNAIQPAYDMVLEQGVDGRDVKRIYSEWQPSPTMTTFIEKNCPNAHVTWSFEEGDEAKFAKEMKKLYSKKWWQFWK